MPKAVNGHVCEAAQLLCFCPDESIFKLVADLICVNLLVFFLVMLNFHLPLKVPQIYLVIFGGCDVGAQNPHSLSRW